MKDHRTSGPWWFEWYYDRALSCVYEVPVAEVVPHSSDLLMIVCVVDIKMDFIRLIYAGWKGLWTGVI